MKKNTIRKLRKKLSFRMTMGSDELVRLQQEASILAPCKVEHEPEQLHRAVDLRL